MSDAVHSREIEVCNNEEERRTAHEDVIVVLVNVCESRWTGLSDCGNTLALLEERSTS
jgi:hypothetical protein